MSPLLPTPDRTLRGLTRMIAISVVTGLWLPTAAAGQAPATAQPVSLVVLIIARFALSDSWVWGKVETEAALTGVPEEEIAELEGITSHALHVADDAALPDTTIDGDPSVVELTEEVRARYAKLFGV